MKHIKMYKILAMALLVLCLGSSCDDYLNDQSPSAFTENTIFSNIDFAQKAVFAGYAGIYNTYAYSRFSMFFYAGSDIEFCIYTTSSDATYAIMRYETTETTNYLQNIWTSLYRAIERVNICIDNLPGSPIWENEETADEARRLYGEAVALRAMIYHTLVSVWGDVPFIIKSTRGDSEFFVPKTNRDEIYDYLIEELKEVEDYVPWMSETTERISKGFIKGLRARMALSYAGYSLRNKTFETRRGRNWQEYYPIARQECLEVMQSGKHQLNPSFENIFKTMCTYAHDLTYKESMFEMAFGKYDVGYMGTFFSGTMHIASDPVYGRGGSDIASSPAYYYSFDREDTRRDVTMVLFHYNSAAYPGQQVLMANDGYTYWRPAKFRKEWIRPLMGEESTAGTGVNRPWMRYSDIILMFAEAENEINGPTQAAKDALAMVRKRAFPENTWTEKVNAYVDSVAASKESFFNAIVNERAWEFGGEQYRKFDLVRWNLLGTKISEMKEEWWKIVNDDSKYQSSVPDYLYWKRSSENPEYIEVLNPDYRLPNTTIAGYTKASWLPLLATTYKDRLKNEIFPFIVRGYDPAKNNHLVHIHATVIADSNGVLSNDQIP
jgi:hypothetical protein